jgi:hypothetical protein
MGEPEKVPEPESEQNLEEEAPEEIDSDIGEQVFEEAGSPLEMKVRRRPAEGIEEAEETGKAAAAQVALRPMRRGINPSVAIAIASMSSVVLSVASVAVWAPVELAFVMPWLLASLTTLGIGLGVTATIRCRQG